MSSWKQIECGPCSLSSQYGSYTASLCFIVKQPGAVRGSVETRGEEGREVERCAGWAALIRSRETPLPPPLPPPLHPPQLAASNSNLSCQWQLLKAAGGFGGIMFDFFQISTLFCVCVCVVVVVFSWLCLSRWPQSVNAPWIITRLGISSTRQTDCKHSAWCSGIHKTWKKTLKRNQMHHLTLLTGRFRCTRPWSHLLQFKRDPSTRVKRLTVSLY